MFHHEPGNIIVKLFDLLSINEGSVRFHQKQKRKRLSGQLHSSFKETHSGFVQTGKSYDTSDPQTQPVGGCNSNGYIVDTLITEDPLDLKCFL